MHRHEPFHQDHPDFSQVTKKIALTKLVMKSFLAPPPPSIIIPKVSKVKLQLKATPSEKILFEDLTKCNKLDKDDSDEEVDLGHPRVPP